MSELKNSIVCACDEAYVWGVWLLLLSMQKHQMKEPVLVAAYNWPQCWKDDIKKFPNVQLKELPPLDRRSITCYKPDIILCSESEITTWVDCDGFFSGNCSEFLFDEDPDSIYIRTRTPSEVVELYCKERAPDEAVEVIPKKILSIWQHDVNEKTVPAQQRGCSAALLSIHRKHLSFIEKWRDQMLKVLPKDVSVVDDGNIAYFQTDESVLNSLLLFANDAPHFTKKYQADRSDRAHFVHFGYNPKPWFHWNRYSLRHFDAVMDLIDWGFANGYKPTRPLPFALKRENRRISAFISIFDRYISKWKKMKKKWAQKK